jgi:osomolarity two-component system sensor histidine kinase SLN1
MSKFNDVTQLERQLAQDKLVDTASTVTPTTIPKEFLDLPLPVAQAGTASSPPRKKRKMVRVDRLRVYWAILLKRMGTESPSISTIADSSLDSNQLRPRTDEDPDTDEVDEIVVDRDWAEDMKSSVNHSERAQERSGDSHVTHIVDGTTTSLGYESCHFPDDAGFFRQTRIFLRREVWPAVYKFFYVQFYDEKTERRYRKERWFIRKVLYLC